MGKNPNEPGIEVMQVETPVIDVTADDREAGESLRITSSDESDLEEAIAAIERLERSLRFRN
jgi:hypothetical protein